MGLTMSQRRRSPGDHRFDRRNRLLPAGSAHQVIVDAPQEGEQHRLQAVHHGTSVDVRHVAGDFGLSGPWVVTSKFGPMNWSSST